MRIVMKFGGSSLASAIHIRRAAKLIARQRLEGDQVVVVVSAQGDTTDDLLEKAREITKEPGGRERDMLLCCGEQMSMALMAMQLEAMGCPAVSFLRLAGGHPHRIPPRGCPYSQGRTAAGAPRAGRRPGGRGSRVSGNR